MLVTVADAREFVAILRDAVASRVIRCAQCETPYRTGDLRVVSIRGARAFVAAHCALCHLNGLLSVQAISAEDARASLTSDDVLAAHEALRRIDRLPPESFGGSR